MRVRLRFCIDGVILEHDGMHAAQEGRLVTRRREELREATLAVDDEHVKGSMLDDREGHRRHRACRRLADAASRLAKDAALAILGKIQLRRVGDGRNDRDVGEALRAGEEGIVHQDLAHKRVGLRRDDVPAWAGRLGRHNRAAANVRAELEHVIALADRLADEALLDNLGRPAVAVLGLPQAGMRRVDVIEARRRGRRGRRRRPHFRLLGGCWHRREGRRA